jgi:hypothetical protein
MKQILWIAVMVFGVGCVGSGVQADGWNVCGGCHNGMMAPNKDNLIAKYKTMEGLIQGAQASDSPMMAQIKNNIEGLKAAAAAMGLNAETGKE